MQARPLRVLVADDNRDTVMMLGILLRSEGMVVRLTTRGAEVQAAVGAANGRILLLDAAGHVTHKIMVRQGVPA